MVLVTTAHAQPPRATKKKVELERPARPATGITLPAGAVQVQTTLELGDTTSVAPDIAIGASDNLTLAVITSVSAMTGFRGTAGSGVCISDGCDRRVVNGGVEARFGLTPRLAFDFGVLASSIEPMYTDMKIGLKAKLASEHTYVTAAPNLWIAMDDRHADQLWVPISAWVKIDAVALGVGTGIKGPLAALDDTWSVPLGGLIQTTPLQNLALGASLVFGKVVGGDEVMDQGFQAYAIQVWTTVTAQ